MAPPPSLNRALAHTNESTHVGPSFGMNLLAPPILPSTIRSGSGKKNADKARRQHKRQVAKKEQPGRPRSSFSKKCAKLPSIKVGYNVASPRTANGAFVSLLPKERSGREWSLDELIHRGFKEVKWDGRTPTLLVDEEDRIITVLAGRPAGDDWDEVHTEISTLLHKAGSKVSKPRKQEQQGNFTSLSFGVSYGEGQQAPGNLAHGECNGAVIRDIMQTKAVQRAAGFMNSCFAGYAPKLYEEYHSNLSLLFAQYPHLERIFSNSIFPTATFNCGPRVVSLDRVDNTNIPVGFCAVFACGSYDPVQGGHLILFDLGLVIQFPPGSTILVPPGTLRHGNVSTRPNETHQSFTQYFPGGLLHVVGSTKPALRNWFEGHDDERYQRAMGLFSKISDLQQDQQAVFSLKGSI
ncbi:hypothetical protein JVT61DRAFT_10039 [Boletus reticuloceps]|uniref:Uncharacterized protein n=1 Tax=Boletus reticuloceps TaxID=495285 RepID=A0A8I2YVV5_9AGAM|nr:hypothetical protein JVT61DRAFT_10039 [Boletus reticuloceps]